MDLAPERLHRTAVDIVADLQQDPSLSTELLRAQRQFFGGAPDYVPEGPARTSALARFAEWFVLERESEHLGALPIDAVGGLPEQVRDALRSSLCGLFVVETTVPDLRVRDTATGDLLELESDATLAAGDVVVGRVYPAALDAVAPSPAAAILRQGRAVVAAFQRDVARAALDRRLTQAELEAVLFRNAGEVAATRVRRVPPERLEARLDSLLREGGDHAHSAADISAALEAASGGPGPVMGPLLEALAFDTDVDLDAMRAAMLELWNEHRLRALDGEPQPTPGEPVPEPAPAPVEQEGLGAAIAARIERGLAAHEDIEALFADVEGMLGADSSEESGDEDDDWGSDTPDGDLEALVAEYLWERRLPDSGEPAQVLHAFAAQQRALPVPGLYLEAIPAREVTSFLLKVYLTAPPLERGALVRAHYAALRDFYDWAIETQCYDIDAAMRECARALLEPLPRLERASIALTGDAVSGAVPRPRVLRIARVDGGEVGVVGTDTEPAWIDAPEAARDLCVDDLILAAVAGDGRGGLRIVGPALVLPAAAADLLE